MSPKDNTENQTLHYEPKIFQVFQNVQFNIVQHKKYVKELTKLYQKLDSTIFRASFSTALQYLFTLGDASANVDRIIQFIATFCKALYEDEEEFLMFVFDIIFSCQRVLDQSVRYRASQLLAAILSAMGEDASLDDDLCEKLLASQLERLQDTRACVRCRASIALQRLQNPLQVDDPVTRAYRFHMSCDPSPSVRRAVVMSIAKCSRNLPYVLERLCDVDESVRRAAFFYVAAISVTQLKVRQRIHVLKVGLTERSARVRKVVDEILLPGWLSTYKGNIIELLTAVRLDNVQGAKDSQYVAGKMLESLFKRLPTSELLEWLFLDSKVRVIPADKLNKESAWYWRHLTQHLLKTDDDVLEQILPDLVVFVGYIRAIVENKGQSQCVDPVGFSTRQYVLHELATMLHVYDVSDQVGRTALQKLLFDVLTGEHGPMNDDVTAAFVCACERVLPDINGRVEFLSSIISELREPSDEQTPSGAQTTADVESTEIKIQRARLRVSLNVALEAQDEAVREQNYQLAAECKTKVDLINKQLEELNTLIEKPVIINQQSKEKSDDPDILNRCLTVLNYMMDSAQITYITPNLKLIYDELEVELFRNPLLLQNALKTVALYSLLDKEFAKEHKAFFFTQLLDLTNESIVTTTLECLVDMMVMHGVGIFDDSQPTAVSDTLNDQSNVGKNKKKLYDTTQASLEDEETETIALSPSHTTVIELMLRLMDSECSAYRLIVVEGLCRLLVLEHIASPTIVSRLLLLWFNPATEDEDLLRQTLGVFFQTFATTVDGAQEQIQRAVLPTMKAIVRAPASSPLAELDQEAMLRFIISVTRADFEQQRGTGVSCCGHSTLAMMLTGALVDRPTDDIVPLLCRLLSLCRPPNDLVLTLDLHSSLRGVIEKLPDKQCIRNVSKYLGALEAVEKNFEINSRTTMPTIKETEEVHKNGSIQVEEIIEEVPEIDENSPDDTHTPGKPTDKQADKQTNKQTKPKRGRTNKTTTEKLLTKDIEPVQASSKITPSDTVDNEQKKRPTRARCKGDKNSTTVDQDKDAVLDAKQCELQSDSESASPKRKSKRVNRQVDDSISRILTRSSTQSEDSDETQLHTILYDDQPAQSLLEDSDAESVGTTTSSCRNIRIPETPEPSDTDDCTLVAACLSRNTRSSKRKKSFFK